MRYFILSLVAVACSWGLEDPTAKVAEIRKEAQAKESAYLRDWLGRANLDPVPVPEPENPKDARPSEMAAMMKARRINEALEVARQIRADPATGEIYRVGNDDIRLRVLEAQAGREEKPAAVKEHKAPSGQIKSRPGE